jgi:hypothetical protein
MSLRGWAPGRELTSPRGAWPTIAQRRKGTPARASAMQNARIQFGTVRSRPGTLVVIGVPTQVTSLYNWIAPDDVNLVVFKSGPGIYSYKQSDTTFLTLILDQEATRVASCAPLNTSLYVCGYNTAGNGTFQVRIFDGTGFYPDIAFRAPPVISDWTGAGTSPGLCTLGTHYLGFVYQSRNGYAGKPITTVPYAITATAAGASFNVTATNNGTPDVLTLPGHTFADGDPVTGSGANGDTAINGTFLVTGVAGNNLSLTLLDGTPVNGNGVWTSGGRLTAPDIITAPGNNVGPGQLVTITGALGDLAINGSQMVYSVLTAGSTFTMTNQKGTAFINNSGTYTGGGVVTTPMQVTLTASGQIDISVDIANQTDGGLSANGQVQATLFLIMTRASNPFVWYFIPTNAQTGQVGEQPVPYRDPFTPPVTSTLHFTANISDEDMATNLAGDTADQNFDFLTQAADGTGPFIPSFVVAYGNRMCYGVGSTLYASDINNPQQIAADRNAVRMQNQRKIGAAFQLPGNTNLYLTGDRWTGYVTDNGDFPSTWSPPVGVSDTLGAPFPECICAATAGNWAWIVTEAGPYLYDGAYGDEPLTYLFSGFDELGAPVGWKRVNWNAAYAVQIKDNVQEHKLYIAVPLDGATEPNYMFTIDYLQGKTFDTCDISLDLFNPATFSSLGIIKEYSTGLSNLWIGPSAAGSIRRLSSDTVNDEGLAIESFWESGLMRGAEFASSMIRVGAIDVWARGNAPLDADGNPTFGVTLYGPDHIQSVPFSLLSKQGVPSALTPTPGIGYMSKGDISQIENYTVRVGTNSVDAWWEVSMIRPYARQNLFNR